MKLPIILSLLILSSSTVADADIYKWTNAQGVVSYTDDPARIHSRYRKTALKVQGLTTLTRQQEENALRDELTNSWQVTTSDSGQSTPAAPGKQQPAPTPRGDQSMPVPFSAQPAPVQ